MSAARAHQPPRTQLSAAGSEAQDTGNFSGKPSVQIRSNFSCLEDRKGQSKKEKKSDNTNTWDVVMSVWECLRSRREQKLVGGHWCRGSALSQLSSRSPRRARVGHIVPKQRRAAAHRARRAARRGRRDPGPSPSTGFVKNASAREESNTGWWSSVPCFSAFPAVATVPKAREGGAHSTQASPSSSVSAQPRSVRLRVILRVVRFPLRVGVRRRVPTPVVLM